MDSFDTRAKIRNVMKMKRLLTGILTLSLLAGCQKETVTETSSVNNVYSNTSTKDVFDTVYSFTEYNEDREMSQAHFKESENFLEKYTQYFDIYNTYDGINNLKTINDNAGKQPVEVDQVIIDMLKMAKDFYEYSDGEFDVTMGSLLKVWHNYREDGISKNEEGELGEVPEKEELEEANQYKGWEYVEIDDENNTVFITDENVSLDVGGIAKGYAAERAAQSLIDLGMTSGILNVGRNIRLVGLKNDSESWTVGITDPDGAMTNGLVIMKLSEEESIVTSGDYERYYIGEDNQRYSHIIDPSTLYPADLYRSVSIITKDSGAADCFSTSLFTMSIEDGKKMIQKYEEATGEEVNAIWVMEQDKTQDEEGKIVGDYYVVYTDGLEDLIQWQ